MPYFERTFKADLARARRQGMLRELSVRHGICSLLAWLRRPMKLPSPCDAVCSVHLTPPTSRHLFGSNARTSWSGLRLLRALLLSVEVSLFGL